MIASFIPQEGKHKGGGTFKLKDNVDRRAYGLFIYILQGRMWAENLGEISNNPNYEVLEQPFRNTGAKTLFLV